MADLSLRFSVAALRLLAGVYTSIVAVLLLDYFFEPPLFSFEVESPGMFVALVTFEADGAHDQQIARARDARLQEKRPSIARGWSSCMS
jgi:K+-sensing histidine kinase KdpD